jgi:hypothetical protein
MWLLFKTDNHITWEKVKTLLRFPFKHHLIPINHTFLNFKLQISGLHHYSLTLANRTFFGTTFPCSGTFFAFHLQVSEFSIDPGTPGHFPCSIAIGTVLDYPTFISRSFTFFAYFSSTKTKYHVTSLVELCQGHRHLRPKISSFWFRVFLYLF